VANLAIIRPLPATYAALTAAGFDRLGEHRDRRPERGRGHCPATASAEYSTSTSARTKLVGATFHVGRNPRNATWTSASRAGTQAQARALTPPRRLAPSTAGCGNANGRLAALSQYLLTFTPQLFAIYVRIFGTIEPSSERSDRPRRARASSFKRPWGQEWGAGRGLDRHRLKRRATGRAGSAFSAARSSTSYDWTLGDLDRRLRREALFRPASARSGETESDDRLPRSRAGPRDLDARLHYGLFQRLEKV
jgi:hypothetical protein